MQNALLKNWHMIAWERDVKNLKTVRLYGDKYMYLDKKLTRDRCPHRGASLSKGKVVDKCVICPYHARGFSDRTHPDMFRGVVKDGALWYGDGDPADIPRVSEFDDPSYQSLYMTRHLKGVNAWAWSEATSDFEHVKAVHKIYISDLIAPELIINEQDNTSVNLFKTPKMNLKVETSFWVPFSNCLKFYVTDKRKNKVYEPLILMFSMTPHGVDDMTLHIRSLRRKVNRDLDVLLDVLFTGISDLPIREDYTVVKTIETKDMLNDQLSPEDALIKLYRKRMMEKCPEIIDYFLK